MPPMNSLPMETLVMMPYRTKGLLGGIMAPMVPAQAIRAPAKGREYPRSTMEGTTIMPMAATVARAEPEIAPKSVHATMVVRASPPVCPPMSLSARLKRSAERPPLPMNTPAAMKKNMASMGKESREVKLCCAATFRDR